MDLVLTAADDDVATGAAVRVDGFGLLEEPDAHLEAEVLGGEGTNGADVDGVKGIIAVEALAGMDRKVRVSTAVDEAETIVLGHLVHEANAPRAENAAFVVEHDAFADIDMLRLLDLGILKA